MTRHIVAFGTVVTAVLIAIAVPQAQQARQPAAALKTVSGWIRTSSYLPPKTPWGDPNIQGGYSNVNENGIPFEKPGNLASRQVGDIDDSELAELNKERNERALAAAAGIGGRETGAGPVHWYEHYDAKNSRPWLVIDPADGKIPPTTPEAQKRAADRAARRVGRGPADSYEDRSLYDQCITRGLPGSMMPAIYGNSYQIHQGPGFAAIRYEMIHETRIIPLDGRTHVSSKIPAYMGDARGRWEDSTLVVETTNFRDPNRGASEKLRLVERFKPIGPNKVEWSVTYEDPATWVRPWTFAMTLTKDPTQPPFEYACHEGNYGLANILSAARAEDKAGRATAPDAPRGER